MPALKNARHEAFARGIVEGRSARQAYISAGYSENGADQSASRLLSNAEVSARVAELKDQVAAAVVKTAAMSEQEALEALSTLGRSNARDYATLAYTGDLRDLTVEQSACVQELTTETYLDGHGDDAREVKRVKFKLYDKRASLVDILRYHGAFKDKVEHSGPDGGPIETREIGDVERARRVAFLLGLAAKKKGG